mmetsp:Transcript_114794/g.307831  ORF Transcript_114794/g.307831 Transcript_114794/m.307831 type:complete len:392 (+) Transcript_114794:492-1667(+)
MPGDNVAQGAPYGQDHAKAGHAFGHCRRQVQGPRQGCGQPELHEQGREPGAVAPEVALGQLAEARDVWPLLGWSLHHAEHRNENLLHPCCRSWLPNLTAKILQEASEKVPPRTWHANVQVDRDASVPIEDQVLIIGLRIGEGIDIVLVVQGDVIEQIRLASEPVQRCDRTDLVPEGPLQARALNGRLRGPLQAAPGRCQGGVCKLLDAQGLRSVRGQRPREALVRVLWRWRVPQAWARGPADQKHPRSRNPQGMGQAGRPQWPLHRAAELHHEGLAARHLEPPSRHTVLGSGATPPDGLHCERGFASEWAGLHGAARAGAGDQALALAADVQVTLQCLASECVHGQGQPCNLKETHGATPGEHVRETGLNGWKVIANNSGLGRRQELEPDA